MRVSRVAPFARCVFSFQQTIASVALFCAAAVLSLATPPANGQTQAAPGKTASVAKSVAPAAQTATATESPDKGLSTSIKVHGHWVIEVKNPDGKLVSHTEFENSLNSAFILAHFLTGNSTVGEWGILLGDPKSPPCTATILTAFNNPYNGAAVEYQGPFCVLSQMAPPAAIYPQNCNSGPNSGCAYNLQFGYANNLDASLGLSGSVTVPNSGIISQVQTIVSACGNNVAPSTCPTETSQDSPTIGVDKLVALTGATLPQSNTTTTPCGGSGQISCAVSVTAGQTVNVSVTLSFQ
jgi:hypothetical protein